MKQQKVGVANSYMIPVAQGTTNPILRNTLTRIVNIDSQADLSMMYDLIGELNEVVAHELRHSHQKTTGSYELTPDTDEDQGLNYYTKPHEIDAQYYGFKRMSKITGKPFEVVVRNWFDTHRDIHQMNKFDSNKVINKILNHKTN